MNRIPIMEEMVPAPAPPELRAQRYSAVSWAPTMLLLFSLTRPRVKLRSPLQSSGQVSESFLFSAYFLLISRHPNVCIHLCFYKWNSLCLSDIGCVLKIDQYLSHKKPVSMFLFTDGLSFVCRWDFCLLTKGKWGWIAGKLPCTPFVDRNNQSLLIVHSVVAVTHRKCI